MCIRDRYVEGGGEAAFYGPKIDVQIRNVNGKEDTIATIQVDFYSASRFNLTFINKEGKKEAPVIIHRAIMGSFERFFAFLIEQYGGAFPVWLASTQVTILPVSDKTATYAKQIEEQLQATGIRAVLDASKETLGKRIRKVKEMKVPYYVVLGEQEQKSNSLTVEHRDDGKLGTMSTKELIAKIKAEEIST